MGRAEGMGFLPPFLPLFPSSCESLGADGLDCGRGVVAGDGEAEALEVFHGDAGGLAVVARGADRVADRRELLDDLFGREAFGEEAAQDRQLLSELGLLAK